MQLGRGWVTMPSRFLHVLQRRPVLKRRRNERRPHRVCQVPRYQADTGVSIFSSWGDRAEVELPGRSVRLALPRNGRNIGAPQTWQAIVGRRRFVRRIL